MKRSIFCTALLFLLTALFCSPVIADEERPSSSYTWRKGYLNLGYYFAGLDSSIRIGDPNAGLGLEVDVESLLGLDTTDSTFRLEGGYRFGQSQRHQIVVGWFRFDRSGSTELPNQIDLPDGGSIGPGQFDSVFNFDIIEARYDYSVVFDKRVDLNLGVGLYIMPIEFGYTGRIDGVGQSTIQESITAPLPVVGVGFDFAISQQWYMRQQAELFYLSIDNYTGGIANLMLSLEYLPWKHVGFGAGINWMQVFIEAEKETDVPGVDFIGDVEFSYFGALLYLKLYL